MINSQDFSLGITFHTQKMVNSQDFSLGITFHAQKMINSQDFILGITFRFQKMINSKDFLRTTYCILKLFKSCIIFVYALDIQIWEDFSLGIMHYFSRS